MYPTTIPRMTEQDKSHQPRPQQQQRRGIGRGVATGNRGYPSRKPHRSVNEADTQSLVDEGSQSELQSEMTGEYEQADLPPVTEANEVDEAAQ
eukprot:10097357-Karenia_brevis.AAC.1